MTSEKVIFRREYDPYRKQDSFLAVYPDDPANPGCYAALPFYFCTDWTGNQYTIFEAHCEVSQGYYYNNTKIVHKRDPIIPDLLSAISRYEVHPKMDFKVCEKITWRKRQ